MVVICQFKADLFTLKHARDPEGYLQALKDQYAREFGMKIIEKFPFEKIEGSYFKGELPAMSLNRDHEYIDLYESRLIVLSEKELSEILSVFSEKLTPSDMRILKEAICE